MNKRYLKSKKYYFFWVILFVYLFPLIIFGQNSYVLIHDMLDFYLPNIKTVIESGMTFATSSATIEQLMNAPRVTFENELNIVFWLFYFFDPYTAYVFNQILIRVIAFIGMCLLLDRYVFQQKDSIYSSAIAILYSLLPFYATSGLSVAGLPLITYIFLNIRSEQDTKKDWIGLILFPFYSSFVLSMMFYIIFTVFVWLYDLYNKKVTKNFTIALFSFGILYLIINYRLLEVFIFGSDFVSHRVERGSAHYGVYEAIVSSIKYFILGQYHAHSLHVIFLPFVGIVFLLNLFSKSKDKLFIGLFILNIFISLWYGFWKFEGWETLKESFSLLASFNLSRFHFLTPLIWYILFALSIRYVIKNYHFKLLKPLIWMFISVTFLFMFYKSDFVNEYRINNITYKQFYAKKLFDNIKKFIGKKQNTYKVVSIGVHPGIARYSGFYTLDGYLVNYDLNYKHQFRKIIASELEKNEKLRRNYDSWGNRCYVFIDEIGYNFVRKKDEVYPINLDLNTTALYQMGGRYIFSSYEIKNYKENNMNYLKVFEDENSAWDIYLYEVKGNKQ